MHASADPQEVAVALVRGSFEYQGQKCSAASRAYIPDTLWPEVRDRALALVGEIHQGDPADLTTFMGAVIDGRAFARLRDAFDLAEGLDERAHRVRRRRRRQRRLVRRADDHRDDDPHYRHHGARAVRAAASRSTRTPRRATPRRSSCATAPRPTR